MVNLLAIMKANALKGIAESTDTVVRAVCNGQAKDYAEYKQMVGRLKGLAESAVAIQEAYDKLNSEDSDDE